MKLSSSKQAVDKQRLKNIHNKKFVKTIFNNVITRKLSKFVSKPLS